MSWNWELGVVETIIGHTEFVTLGLTGLEYYRGDVTREHLINEAKLMGADNFTIIRLIKELDALKQSKKDKEVLRQWYKSFGTYRKERI